VPICVIFNPAARGEKSRRFRKHLGELASDCALKPTWAAGTGRILAAEAVRDGFDTIVAAGGDGTLNEVLNGIGDVPGGFALARLGVLPLGTVNVFAKEIGLPMNLTKAWHSIRKGRELMVDLPFAEFTDGSVRKRQYFAQMAGAGLDARAIELVNWELKKKIAQFAYVVAGLQAMRGPHPQITARNGSHSATGELVLVGNGRFYGGRIPIFHRASLTDGLIDVCVFPRANWFTVLRYAFGLLSHRVTPPADLQYFQTAKFSLEMSGTASFHLEGDLSGRLPVDFGIIPMGLRIIAGP
jgi:YegS/Rv2252/BmrU family lipid kinase